jgi:diguanylate cyclase (GGDEF)-like protein
VFKLKIEDGQMKEYTWDTLTGLLDRGAICRLVEQELQLRRADPWPLTPLAVMQLDVDRFNRSVNHEYGHLAGDQVLAQLGSLLKATVRPGDSVGRYGGDLFLILAPRTGPQQAQALAERVRRAVEESTFYYENSFCEKNPESVRWKEEMKITVRIGIGVIEAGLDVGAGNLIFLAHYDKASANHTHLALFQTDPDPKMVEAACWVERYGQVEEGERQPLPTAAQ